MYIQTRQRLKGCKSVTEEQFEELSGKYCKHFVIKTKRRNNL